MHGHVGFIPIVPPLFGARKQKGLSPVHCSPLKLAMSVATTKPSKIVTLPDGSITTPLGFKAAGGCAGFKGSKSDDLAIVVCENDEGCTAAGSFTQSVIRAAPVDYSEKTIQEGSKVKAIIVNSGQANACCGKDGQRFVEKTAKLTSEKLGAGAVLLMSTGCIGQIPSWELMEKALPDCIERTNREGGDDAAKAILTTDLVKKQVALEREINGKTTRVAGMAKGSGMIHPNMATMLSVVTCDADVETSLWKTMLSNAVRDSFNMISVDGDTSTNDSVYALASGASGVSIPDQDSPGASLLQEMLSQACIQLAKSIARDGEGATVLLEVRVSGAPSDSDARKIARSVTASHLFKAAVYGRDPNWGRILGAVGYAGVDVKLPDISVNIGPIAVLRHGQPVSFDRSKASQYMANAEKGKYLTEENTIVIDIQLGEGPGTAVAWGCDLTYKYVEINAEYTT